VTISGSATGLSNPNGVAFDSAGDLFVTNEGNAPVTEHAPGASGDVSPIATVQGASTLLNAPDGIAVDPTGRMYVANLTDGTAGTVTEYAAGARGNAAPTVTISGAATKLTEPDAVGPDDAGELFVGDFHNLVAVFAGADLRSQPDPQQAPARRHDQTSVPRDAARSVPRDAARSIGHDPIPLVTDARPAARRPPSQSLRDALGRPAPAGPPVGDDRRHRRRHPRMTARRRFLVTIRCPTVKHHRTCGNTRVSRRKHVPFHFAAVNRPRSA
jgi:hypothetical protein